MRLEKERLLLKAQAPPQPPLSCKQSCSLSTAIYADRIIKCVILILNTYECTLPSERSKLPLTGGTPALNKIFAYLILASGIIEGNLLSTMMKWLNYLAC